MKSWSLIARMLAAGGSCALVSVIRTQGSAPREEGARMVVGHRGFHGTIGGGALEWKALALAQALLDKPRQVKIFAQSLGPDLGQCCGGRVTLAVESFDATCLTEVEAYAAREATGPFTVTGRSHVCCRNSRARPPQPPARTTAFRTISRCITPGNTGC